VGLAGASKSTMQATAMSELGHSRQGRAATKPGRVRCAAESGSKFPGVTFRRTSALHDLQSDRALAEGWDLGPDQTIAIQSISISNGPVHSGMQTKMRAGGSCGK
jgi:hypothetical protein